MERPRCRNSAWGRRAPQKKRRSSPLPGGPAPPGRLGSARCRRRLFGSAGRGEAEPGCLKGKSSVKTLPKIKENFEATKVSTSSDQSSRVNVKEIPFLEKAEGNAEDSTVPQKESLITNFESKESLKDTDVTSGTGMTLPTGVSTFFLECLGADSTADYNTGTTDSMDSFSSPETLREEEGLERSNPNFEDFVKCKNSTLLDSSKAVAIDQMPQISSLSPILEPVLEDCQGVRTRRKRPSKCNSNSSELSVSTTLAGKKICKIAAARERTPDLRSGTHCSSPVGPERKPDSQTAKLRMLKCRRKEEFSSPLEDNASPLGQLESAPANVSARSLKMTTEVLPCRQTDAVVQTSSTTQVMEKNKALGNTGDVQPALDPLYYRKEICSIVRTSPDQRPSRRWRIPVDTKAFCLPEGVPEDDTCYKMFACIVLSKIGLLATKEALGVLLLVKVQDKLKMLLQVPKIGSAVNTNEASEFQQESTEEVQAAVAVR